MHLMDDFPEAAVSNIHMFPGYEYAGAIPFLSFTGFDLVTNIPVTTATQDYTGGVLTINIDKTLDAMKPVTFAAVDFNLNMVTSTWVKNNLFHNVNLVNRISTEVMLPKSLFVMGWKGNEPFIGDYLDLSGMGVNVLHYTELSYGITQKIGDNFTIGTKFKFLQGLSNISTYRSDIKLKTDTTTFWLTGNLDAQINVSGPLDTNGVTIYSYSDYMLNMRNPGFGMDIGISYRPIKMLRLSADLVDLGAIKFNTGLKSYAISGKYQFKGLELGNAFSSSFDTIIMDLLDTVMGSFTPVRTEQSYVYYTTPKLYASAELILNKNNKFNVLYHRRLTSAYNYNVLSAGYQHRFGRALTTMVNYSMLTGNNHRVGAGLNIKMGMMNLYFLTDDILDVIKPFRTQSVNFYFGINFIHFPPTQKQLDKQKKKEEKREEKREEKKKKK